jgi:hypothetical protein
MWFDDSEPLVNVLSFQSIAGVEDAASLALRQPTAFHEPPGPAPATPPQYSPLAHTQAPLGGTMCCIVNSTQQAGEESIADAAKHSRSAAEDDASRTNIAGALLLLQSDAVRGPTD